MCPSFHRPKHVGVGVFGARTSSDYASSRLVAFDTPGTRGMEKQERVASQAFDRNSDNVPSARKPSMSVSYAPFGLEAPRP